MLATSQAAEKVYRSAEADVDVGIDLAVGAGGWMEWLPQETILFDGARLRRSTTLWLAPSARLLAVDILVFGRQAHGEMLRSGALTDTWRVYRGERLVWADVLRMQGDLQERLGGPFAFAGARSMATVLYAASDAGAWLDSVRAARSGAGPRWGATELPGVLLARGLGDPRALRRQVADLTMSLRHATAGLPARLPATWWT